MKLFPFAAYRQRQCSKWAVACLLGLVWQPLVAQNSSTDSNAQQTQTEEEDRAEPNSNNSENSDSGMPQLDMRNDTVSWNGQVWSLSDHRMFRARLEKYLAAPAADPEEDEAYRKILSDIVGHLSPHLRGGRPDLPAAVALLPMAAEYDIDAKLSDTLANSIYGVWLAQKNIANLERTNRVMSGQVRNQTFSARHSSDADRPIGGNNDNRNGNGNNRQGQNNQGQNNPQGGGGGMPQAPSAPQTPTLSNQQTLRGFATARHISTILELEAKIKSNEALMGTSELIAKAEYQGLILQFLMQRRYEHVLLGTRFYRNLFRDPSGQIQLHEGSQGQKTFLNSLGSSPTINTLDSFANEAVRDVSEAVDSFYHLLERGDMASASQRISEAFITGEYLAQIRRVPLDKKMQVLEFVRDGHQLLSAMEVKDYTLAETLVTKMRGLAKDFDYSKPLAIIQTAKTASDMHLNRAKVAAMRGNEKDSTLALTDAAKIWPTNPKLKEFTNMIGENADIKTQTVLDLDRLMGQKNYRQIYNDQGRFLASVLDDPERQEKLKKVLTDMNRLNLVIAGAQSQLRSNNPMGAWESVEKAYLDFPEDPEIARLRSDLSLQATEFVSAIQKARQHEEKRQIGSSFSWYLKAKSLYPPSEIAREGIQRHVEILGQAR